MRYSTKQDAIAQDIAPALEGYEADFDMDAIFAKAFKWDVTYDEHGRELVTTAGFEQCVSEPEFWAIVKECVIA